MPVVTDACLTVKYKIISECSFTAVTVCCVLLSCGQGVLGACEGPTDILADKVCASVIDSDTCLKCVKKIFRNEGTCDFNLVQFPPQLSACQETVKDKTFVDKLNELSMDKYIGKIEGKMEQIPKLKGTFCSGNQAVEDFMKSEEEDTLGLPEQVSVINKVSGADEGLLAMVSGALGDVGGNVAKRNDGFSIKEFKSLIDKICGKDPICGKINNCMEGMVGYVIDYAA